MTAAVALAPVDVVLSKTAAATVAVATVAVAAAAVAGVFSYETWGLYILFSDTTPPENSQIIEQEDSDVTVMQVFKKKRFVISRLFKGQLFQR